MRAIILAVLLSLCVATSYAADKDGNYAIVSYGTKSCGAFVEATKTPEILDYKTWLTGYLTAYNAFTPKVTNVLEGTDLDGAMGFLKNYCANNPLNNFAYASAVLVLFLTKTKQ